MKKMRTKTTLLLVMFVSLILLLTACAQMKDYAYDENISEGNSGSYDDAESDMEDSDSPGEGSSALISSLGEIDGLNEEKIIRMVDLDVETLEFDDLINTIEEEVKKLDGYIENLDISGIGYNSWDSDRYATIIARIPKDNLDDFIVTMDDNANIVNRTSSIENVTLEYIDTESRKKSLEIEQERLFELLEEADSIDMIITLESRLTNVRYELQNYETKLSTIDNRVDYSTVTMNINEVKRMSPNIEDKATVISRIKTGFSETVYNLSEGAKDFFVWFVVNLLYLIIWAVIIIVAIIIVRKIYLNRNKINDKPSIKDKDINQTKEEDEDTNKN